MNPKLYLQTSIISYLTARVSRDLITAARQQTTQEWWEYERHRYDLFVSEAVVAEAERGDTNAAQLRLAALVGVPEVLLTPEASSLTKALLEPGPIPNKAVLDATHIAAATLSEADYLLAWSFRHLANAVLRKQINAVCRSNGYEPPVICTPEELLEL